jgi:hypothetical protein
MPESKTTVPGFLPELSFRPCCLLADRLGIINDVPVFGALWPRIMVDLSGDNLRHVSGTTVFGMFIQRLFQVLPGVSPPERSGTLYTCAAGFVDLGHLRDFADLTRHYYYGLVRRRTRSVVERGTTVPLLQTHGGIAGEVILQRDVPAANPGDLDSLIDVARSIAYDVSIMYEIKTYGEMRVGGRSSSFSPEDLVSNYLGTYVGGRALKRQVADSAELPTGEPGEARLATTFDAAVTVELAELFLKLHAVDVEHTLAAFNTIKGRWVKDEILPPNFLDVDYVQRRNFHTRPIQPWLVPGACVDTDFPEEVDRQLPDEAVTAHLSHYFFESSFFENLLFLNRDFEQYIDKVKADARVRYGSETFDRP